MLECENKGQGRGLLLPWKSEIAMRFKDRFAAGHILAERRQWYENFSQTTDDEVLYLLKAVQQARL